MFEAVAIAAGCGIGLALAHTTTRLAIAIAAAGAILVGFVVSALSGELELSLGFFVFDTGQVLVAALAARALARAYGRRRAGPIR